MERRDNAADGRLVEVHLTAKGRRCMLKLAAQHGEELAALTAVVEAMQSPQERG